MPTEESIAYAMSTMSKPKGYTNLKVEALKRKQPAGAKCKKPTKGVSEGVGRFAKIAKIARIAKEAKAMGLRQRTYLSETYAEVTRWAGDTCIEYSKRSGNEASKRMAKYQKYSAAKTVEEALSLGSSSEDLIDDYQRGFLKRVGGAIRDQPLGALSETERKAQTLTKTDSQMIRWYDIWQKQERALQEHGLDAATPSDVASSDTAVGVEHATTPKRARAPPQHAGAEPKEEARSGSKPPPVKKARHCHGPVPPGVEQGFQLMRDGLV